MEEIKPNTYIPSRKLRVEALNNLMTFLPSEEADLNLIPQNDYSRVFPC